MVNRYKQLIDNYKNMHIASSVEQLKDFIDFYGRSFEFTLVESSDYVYKDDMLLYKALLLLVENNFVGHIHEHCEALHDDGATVIYSKELQRFFRLETDMHVVSADLDYHEGVSDLIKCKLMVEDIDLSVYSSRCYLLPDENKRVGYTFDVKGNCEDVTDTPRYKRMVLLQ